MKKSNKANRVKVKADLKSLSDPSDDVSNENEEEKFKEKDISQSDDFQENHNIYHCPKCYSIPLITVKDNENKVIIDCLNNHHTEMLFSEYMSPEFQKNINNIKCSNCKIEKNSSKFFCFECQKVFCKDCLSFHSINNSGHHANNIKSEFSCPIHMLKYAHYCFDCKKNLCDKCLEDKNDNHQIIHFKDINLKNNELVEFKNNLEKENELLFKIKKIFNDTLATLSNKFNDIISYKFLCLKYKNNIINTYEANDINYQIIDNINHLKFITKTLKIEPEMNELDIIYELFNFLDSIEYNDEYNTNGNIFDSKNKIEESEHEDEDIENNNENISENNKLDNNLDKSGTNKDKKIKEKKGEESKHIDKEEDEKNNNLSQKENYADNIEEKNNFIKISDNNNKNIDNYNSSETDINNKTKEIIINEDINSDIINQISPEKMGILNIIENNYKEENNNNTDSISRIRQKFNENIKDIKIDKNEDKIKEENTKENESDNDDNNSNENDENIFIYKSNRHIPVNSEYSQNNINETENNEKNNKDKEKENQETKEKIQKKKKKKIIKKKKAKISTKPNIEYELKENENIKGKKKIIKKNKVKEENKEGKEKEDSEKDKGNINENIHIEINYSDSQEVLNNNINKDENKKEEKGNNKEKSKENELIKSNDYISATEEKEKSPDINSNDIFSNDIASNDNISNDNTSNDYKIEEVHSYNPEETKRNKSKKTKVIKIKKKKKLNISITDKKNEQNNKQKYIINPEDNNPINVALKKSLNYKNNESDKDISDSIKDNNDNNNNIYFDEESKRSQTSYKNNKNKSSTITKKLNFGNLDKDENEEEENKEKNIPETNNIHSINNKNIQANDQDTSKDNDNSEDLVNKMNKFNNIVNLHIKYNGKIDSNKKSPIIKKRKIIKKKKFLISLDNKGSLRPNIEEKQIKITKRTTLIRSRSKDKPKERKISQDTFDSNISKDKIIKNKEINFKIFKNEGENSSNHNEENSSISIIEKRQKEINNIQKINKIKNDINNALNKDKNKRKIKLAQGKNNTALLLENTEEVYIEEKNIRKVKKTGLSKLEREINKERTLNKSVDDYKNRHKRRRLFNEYSYDEMKYLLDRSNSYKKIKKYKKFSDREKINCIKFENGVSCLLEINSEIFALGNLIGDIIIINSHNFKEIQVIREHDGTIISLYLLNDKSILSCSADRKILKLRLSDDGTKYNIEFTFHGYENYILKAIELMNSLKIITCSWDNKIFVWEREDRNIYKNTLKFNEGERVVDLLEINSICFVSISENNELKLWNSDTYELIDTIKNIKCSGSPNTLCKINDIILSVLDYHEIQLIDITSHCLINRIFIDDGNLSCILKLKDNSILVAEDYNNDKYCVFYIKQFYYEDKDLKSISNKKDKFYKTNKNNDKEIRALIQFSNGVIVQGITGEYNGKDSGDLFFYY